MKRGRMQRKEKEWRKQKIGIKSARNGADAVNDGLYGSTSCCISHEPSQWERAIFDPPQLGDPSTDFHET